MRKVKYSYSIEEIENFKIEENIYVFSGICSDIQNKFAKDLVERELCKSFDKIEKKDSKKIADAVMNLSVSERFYAISGLLENYNLSTEDKITVTVEKALADKRLNEYRDIILSFLNTVDKQLTEGERLSAQEKVEKFEKENDIEFLIEE